MQLETLRQFRLKDIALLFSFNLLLSIANWTTSHSDTPTTFYIMLTIFYFLIGLSLLLINRTGTIILFCLISVFTTNLFPTNNIYQELFLFLIVSLIFEIAFMFFKLEFKSIKLDLLLGASLSSATIPWMLLYFSKAELTNSLLTNTINLSAINFLIGIIGTIIASAFWHQIRKSKAVIRFEYE